MYKIFIQFLLLSTFIPSLLHAGESITLASTTSTQKTGFLEYLLPLFKQEMGIEVQVVVADTEDALKLGQAGKVDVVLTHDEDLEKQLVNEGYFIDRENIMYNDFIVLGPANDPEGIQELKTAAESFNKIRSAKTLFISRGDNSETNMRENRIWAMTGTMPERGDSWYISASQGMAETICIAAQKQAYTLADRISWYSTKESYKKGLDVLLEGDPVLVNQYGVMIVNPKNHKDINYQSAMNFVIWMTSPACQNAIAAFKDSSGQTIYTPNAR